MGYQSYQYFDSDMSLEGFIAPDVSSAAPCSTANVWSSPEGSGWSLKAEGAEYTTQMGQWQQTLQDEVTQPSNVWPSEATIPHQPAVPPHVQPQYWQQGVMPQYGVMPQDGVMPQYGVMPQDGVMPQYGVMPQDGVMTQYGVMPQDGAVPIPMQFEESVPQPRLWSRQPASQPHFVYPPVQLKQSVWPAGQCLPRLAPNHNWQHPAIGGKNMFQCISSDHMKQGHQCTGNRGDSQPRVHITITPAQNRVVKKTKRKRIRTAFTTDQILYLEKVYSRQTYVSRNERQQLTKSLNISDRAIKVWFQNRRMKGKRESQAAFEDSDECEQNIPEQPDSSIGPLSSGDSNGSISSPISNLDYVESQIQRTDEFGYVTLDDKSWGALFNVIDAYVPDNIEVTSSGVKEEFPKVENDVIYEPISPADSNYSAAEDIESYEPPKDEEGLKNLFNIHFC